MFVDNQSGLVMLLVSFLRFDGKDKFVSMKMGDAGNRYLYGMFQDAMFDVTPRLFHYGILVVPNACRQTSGLSTFLMLVIDVCDSQERSFLISKMSKCEASCTQEFFFILATSNRRSSLYTLSQTYTSFFCYSDSTRTWGPTHWKTWLLTLLWRQTRDLSLPV